MTVYITVNITVYIIVNITVYITVFIIVYITVFITAIILLSCWPQCPASTNLIIIWYYS